MGCCHSTPDSSPYNEGNSSSRAINRSQSQSHAVLPRQSASAHSNRPNDRGHSSQPLSQHINRPLTLHSWTSNQQVWNRVSIDREREEFFETRVTGRPEIWQTIHAALEVLWKGGDENDHDGGLGTAQSILTAAEITVPSGNLTAGAYDSLGGLYQLPEYIVSDPTNLAVVPARGNEENKSEDEMSEEEIKRRDEKGKSVMVDLTARLSDNGGSDITLKVGKDESVRLVTRRIFDASQHQPPKHIKLAYRGKLLALHKSLADQGWEEGNVVNAMVFG